jgi:uridine monophosphate synthetase
LGVVVNSSRGIIYAGDPRAAATELRQQIVTARQQPTPSRFDARTHLTLSLADIGAIQFGEFTLASGKRSPIYIDLRLLASYPAALRLVAQAYASLLRDELSLVEQAGDVRLAAIPYAAMPIGTAVALELDLPLIYPRKEAKAYGTSRQIEGAFQPGDRAVVLDDLITTGGSKLAAIEPLEAAGLEVQDVFVLIDREQGGREDLAAAGYRLHAVLRLGEMLDTLVRAGRLEAAQRDQINAFLWGE